MCWIDIPSDTTNHCTGARSIPIKTSGHKKDDNTVILTAQANRVKFKPYCVQGQGIHFIKSLQKIKGVVVRFSVNGWMNNTVTSDYLRTIIGELTFRR